LTVAAQTNFIILGLLTDFVEVFEAQPLWAYLGGCFLNLKTPGT
jgi:hypothetical protein